MSINYILTTAFIHELLYPANSISPLLEMRPHMEIVKYQVRRHVS